VLQVSGPLERARAGDTVAFIEIAHAHDAEPRRRAGDEHALLSAYVAAYRALPGYDGEPPLDEWLAGFVDGPGPEHPVPATPAFWRRLADALAAEAPAVAPPVRPERRFPVIPRLQRRRRRQGPG
jgi:hypothetical protein